MSAYYNEHDPKTAAWLRELIKAGLIADGEVDERSIEDVRPDDLRGFVQCHFFAGIGGWSLALRLAGWPDDRHVWTGSCPCQPFSAAGKGDGFADERHLWPAWFWHIGFNRPGVIFGEQVESPAGRAWLDLVSTDLEATGYACGPSDLPVAGVGAPGIRQRLFWVADAQMLTLGAAGGSAATRGGGAARRLANVPGGGLGIDGSASRQPGHVDERGPSFGLGHAERFNAGRNAGAGAGTQGGSVLRPIGNDPRSPSTSLGMVYRIIARLEGHSGDGGGGYESRRLDPDSARSIAAAGATRGAWDDADWLLCTDGKARPVEPGTFPLAHGIPARVGRLRGYGNAINPYVAAEFIAAYREACEEVF